MNHKKSIYIEVIITTGALILVTSLLYHLRSISFVNNSYGIVFALLFLYVPVVVISRRGRKIDFIDLNTKEYLRSFVVFLIAALIVFPFFFLGAHIWEKIIYNAIGPNWVLLPDLFKVTFFQLIMIALPEEFFFRGYMQSAFNSIYPKKWKFLGASLGPAWIITAFIFAFVHSFIVLQWWHFAIFFPALVFGYLRERTGSITAPILFHTVSNIAINWIAYMYR